MKIVRTDKYYLSLDDIITYISKDSIKKAFSFIDDLDKKINLLYQHPYKFRKSQYFDNESIRDFIFKGYTIPYYIDEKENTIIILGITKYKSNF